MADEPQQPPLPVQPPVFRLAPYRTPYERALERFRLSQEAFQRECERAERQEDHQALFRALMARCGRADWPRHWFPL
jgi:hypothetical protein